MQHEHNLVTITSSVAANNNTNNNNLQPEQSRSPASVPCLSCSVRREDGLFSVGGSFTMNACTRARVCAEVGGSLLLVLVLRMVQEHEF